MKVPIITHYSRLNHPASWKAEYGDYSCCNRSLEEAFNQIHEWVLEDIFSELAWDMVKQHTKVETSDMEFKE